MAVCLYSRCFSKFWGLLLSFGPDTLNKVKVFYHSSFSRGPVRSSPCKTFLNKETARLDRTRMNCVNQIAYHM